MKNDMVVVARVGRPQPHIYNSLIISQLKEKLQFSLITCKPVTNLKTQLVRQSILCSFNLIYIPQRPQPRKVH